jgi:hypothetical protein
MIYLSKNLQYKDFKIYEFGIEDYFTDESFRNFFDFKGDIGIVD